MERADELIKIAHHNSSPWLTQLQQRFPPKKHTQDSSTPNSDDFDEWLDIERGEEVPINISLSNNQLIALFSDHLSKPEIDQGMLDLFAFPLLHNNKNNQ